MLGELVGDRGRFVRVGFMVLFWSDEDGKCDRNFGE